MPYQLTWQAMVGVRGRSVRGVCSRSDMVLVDSVVSDSEDEGTSPVALRAGVAGGRAVSSMSPPATRHQSPRPPSSTPKTRSLM